MKKVGKKFGWPGYIFWKFLKWGGHYKMISGMKNQKLQNDAPPTIKHIRVMFKLVKS